jgi:hypothetical protein
VGQRTGAYDREKLYVEVWKEPALVAPSCQSAFNLDPRGHRNLAHAAEGILLSHRVVIRYIAGSSLDADSAKSGSYFDAY